jgi:hypothetical protein
VPVERCRSEAPQQLAERRFRVGGEIERGKFPAAGRDGGRSRGPDGQPGCLVPDERIRVHLRDLLQQRRRARVFDAAEGIEDLEAQVLLGIGLLVGLEQAGQRLGRAPEAEGRRGGQARFRILQHLQQMRQRRLVADLGQGQRRSVPQPPVVRREKADAVRHGFGSPDRDRDRDGERGLDGVGALVALQEGAHELRPELAQRLDRAVLRGAVRGPERPQERVGHAVGVLGRENAGGELADLRIRVGEQREHLVVAGLGPGEQGRECGDRGVLDAVEVVATVVEQRPDVCLVRVPGEHLDGAEADLLVVVVEGLERQLGRPGRRDGLDDPEGLLAQRRRAARGQGLGDPREGPLVGALAQVVESRMDDDRVRVRQEDLEPVEEVAAGQGLEALHGLPPHRLGLRGEKREERRRRGFVGKALEDGQPALAQGDVLLDPEPGHVFGLDVRRRGHGLEQVVAFGVVLPAARAQLSEQRLRSRSSALSGPHVRATSFQFRDSSGSSRAEGEVAAVPASRDGRGVKRAESRVWQSPDELLPEVTKKVDPGCGDVRHKAGRFMKINVLTHK